MEFDEKILRGVEMLFVSSRIYKKKKEKIKLTNNGLKFQFD